MNSLSDVTVVVPTRNSESTLFACLESIKKQNYPCFLVVVDNYSGDSTCDIARQYADKVIAAGPERSAQRNIGARESSSSIVGFIDSDMVLAPGLIEEVVESIRAGASSVIVPEDTVGTGFWARVSSYERSFYDGSDAIEAPRFFPKKVFDEAGGFDEMMTGAEDWDISLRTLHFGPRTRTRSRITHLEGQVRYFSLCAKKAYYAPGVALFLRKYGTKGLSDMSSRPWLRRPADLLRPLGLGLVVLKTGEAIAMCISLISNYTKSFFRSFYCNYLGGNRR